MKQKLREEILFLFQFKLGEMTFFKLKKKITFSPKKKKNKMNEKFRIHEQKWRIQIQN